MLTRPSNTVTVGKLKRNAKAGTAVLVVRLPGAGKLVVSGKGVKRVVKTAKRAGKVALPIKTTGKAKLRLIKRGRVKLKVTLRFTPTGGLPKTTIKTITLLKHRR